ncbi:MAG: DUF368 domain-containing protein [Eubacteriales bacterium]
MSEKSITNPTGSRNTNSLSKRVIARWFLQVIQGALIGVSAILPGISGGVLCVVFGVYQPMMELLAHPIKTFKTHAKLLLPILIGWILGFLALARLVEWMFNASYNIATWLFIGLIAGMIPSMFKEAGKEGRPKSAWGTLIISTILIYLLLIFIQHGSPVNLQPNIWWFFVCGLLWGISLVIPGLSSSSLLIYLGLYQPMTAGIADLSLTVILPMIIGILFIIFLLARAINSLFKNHYAIAFHIILGFVIASTLAIMPVEYVSLVNTILCIVCFVGGL